MAITFNVFDARDLLFRAFPGGDNDSDTVLGGVHFNRTTLEHWNYTLFDNRTLSNESNCWLVFAPYEPKLLRDNGSFVNATSCYSAIEPIGTRGFVGIAFAVVYGIGLVLSITVLAKHGALYLPKERRFYPIGRRWQWYWACFVCACALISLFTNIDVDRYYLPELPIIVNVFFWFLLCQGTLCLTWEAVRHWGSWLERQYIDPNPFIYKEGDKRWQIEFWMPLWFYFWVWMNFFLVVPRSWNFAKYQRSPAQTLEYAVPAATGGRFKAGAFCLVVAWLTILYSLRHSIRHYRPRRRGMVKRAVGLVQSVPLRFYLVVPLAGALIGYQMVMSFDWTYSLVRIGGVVPVQFGWGYGPALLIVYTQVLYGYASPNEDKELMRQRRERGDVINRELGIVKRPAWWRRVRGEHLHTLRDKIVRNVHEVGTDRGTGRREETDMERFARLEAQGAAVNDDGIELDGMGGGGGGGGGNGHQRGGAAGPAATAAPYRGKSDRRHAERVMQSAASVLFPNDVEQRRQQRAAFAMEEGPAPPPYSDAAAERRGGAEAGRPGVSQRASSASTTRSIDGPPQQVRSMLDI